MSAYQFEEFERRMRRINKRHTKLSRGFTTEINSDGLVVARPARRRSGILLRSLALVAITVLILKGILHAHLGATSYDAQVASLSQGNAVEQVGAWVMAADPVTLAVSHHLGSLVR